MALKVIYGVVALLVLGTYLIAPLIKLKDVALAVVLIVGLTMAAVDLWQSLKSKDD